MGDGFAQCRTVTRMRLTPKDRKAILTMPAPVTLLLRPDGYGIEGHRGTTFPNTCRIRPGKALRLTVARLPSETPASHAGTLRDLAANGVVLIGNPDSPDSSADTFRYRNSVRYCPPGSLGPGDQHRPGHRRDV